MSFEPENHLERALLAAATDRASGEPGFYRAILESPLWLVDEDPPPGAAGPRTLQPGTQLRLRHVEVEGQSYVPVFSALSRLHGFFGGDVAAFSVPGREILAIVRAAHVVLNPGADYGKYLVPDEIGALLDGSIFAPVRTHVVDAPRDVLLAQPAEYPHHLIGALKPVFAARKDVRAAYLAHYHDPARDARPHTLIGIDVQGDWDALMRAAAAALDPVSRPDEVVDFVPIDDSGVSDYLKSTKPFYKKKRFGLF
jgi:hypothetical protein